MIECFHPARVERRPPTTLVVPRELEIVALARHATLNVADPTLGVQPRAEGPEHGEIRVYPSRFQRNEEQTAAAVSHGRPVCGPARAIQSRDPPASAATAGS